ncbi:MAG: hypothetical protein V4819_23410 [Verrucomicrobiota bacterium]
MPAKKTTRKAARKPTMIADSIKSGEIPWRSTSIAARGARSAARGAEELPIGQTSARKVTRWLMTYFGEKLRAAGQGTPFTPDILCAIVCQETAYFWLPLLEKLESKPEFKNAPGDLADVILARCVLDASGDHPDSPRSVFPKNTEAFLKKYGSEFTNFLIEEANQSRKLRGFGPKQWVYKGYGIFQYDLQFVETDEAFFRERQWYDFEVCLGKCIGELKSKYKAVGNDLWEAVRAYNGSGPRARSYRDNVKTFAGWTKDEIGKLPVPRGTRSAAVPASRPRISLADLAAKLAPYQIDRIKYPLVVVGIRGYYMDTMGQPGVNDRGMYDDAIFIHSPAGFAGYNGNTDPSKVRPGSGFNEGTKGMARLNPGAWYAHKIDYHGSKVHGPYRAICQRLGKVTVTRDGKDGKDYEDTGADFGINIHKGSYNGTSSAGCQTLHPDQWGSFIELAMDLAKRYYGAKWDKTVVPYILIEA